MYPYIWLHGEGLGATSESASIEAINSTKSTLPVHYLQEGGEEEEGEGGGETINSIWSVVWCACASI